MNLSGGRCSRLLRSTNKLNGPVSGVWPDNGSLVIEAR
jgi:hypothetical protein